MGGSLLAKCSRETMRSSERRMTERKEIFPGWKSLLPVFGLKRSYCGGVSVKGSAERKAREGLPRMAPEDNRPDRQNELRILVKGLSF